MEAGHLRQFGGQFISYSQQFSFCAFPLGDVRNNTADGADLALCAEQGELLNDARV